ncbi:MAG: hypothetical protein LBD85_06100 [Oscillospiraceae bacterium]|jgi:hypothetical protein|nr:hypothetical protein [Oscillospiraceae bacterium]
MKLFNKYLHEGHHHEHGHEHHHHEHGHEHHLHEHGHEHHHEHKHNHDNAEIEALLGYAIEHNAHHAEELRELAGRFEAAGLIDAAQDIEMAVDGIQSAVDLLGAAQSSLDET